MAKPTTQASPVLTIEAGGSPTTTIVRIPVERRKGWEQWLLLSSDWHFDSTHCDRAALKSALAECGERDAYWCAFGDVFDAMGGKWDPRSGKGDIRPEYQRGDYLDAIVQDAASFIAPYAHRGLVISPGNHETKILEKHETDLVERLVAYTNRDTGSQIRKGTYAGWVMLRLQDSASSTAYRHTLRLRYHHGHGGGGEVTQGVIQAQRRAVYLPDADIVTSGHIHYRWHTEFQRERIKDSGKVWQDTQLHLGLSAWKDEYAPGEGFHVERGRAPRPVGGWWLRLWWDTRTSRVLYDAVKTQ